MERNVLGNCHNERDFGLHSLLDGGCGLVSCYKNGGGIRLELFNRLRPVTSVPDQI